MERRAQQTHISNSTDEIDRSDIKSYISDMLGELSALAGKIGEQDLHNLLVITQRAATLGLSKKAD